MLGFADVQSSNANTEFPGTVREVSGAGAARTTEMDVGCLEALQPRQWLFRAGDVKEFAYRIEAGNVLIANHGADGSLLKARIASRGEVIGLGFLREHRSSAAAISASTVYRYTSEQIDGLCEVDQNLRDQRDAAIRDEFDQIRHETTAASANASLAFRIANFLAVSSRFAQLEGRDPHLRMEELDLNQLVTILGGDPLNTLTALQELERNLVIESHDGRKIEIIDLERLEHLCGTGCAPKNPK
jgi:CRP-like cAMP-binding protein